MWEEEGEVEIKRLVRAVMWAWLVIYATQSVMKEVYARSRSENENRVEAIKREGNKGMIGQRTKTKGL